MPALHPLRESWSIADSSGNLLGTGAFAFEPSIDVRTSTLLRIRLRADIQAVVKRAGCTALQTAEPLTLEHSVFDPPYRLHVSYFGLPAALQATGLARFFWHRYCRYLPQSILGESVVHGVITEVSTTDAITRRKNQLWADLCGHSAGDVRAKFIPQNGRMDGRFSGPLHDPWVKGRSRFLFTHIQTPGVA
jgi:hypothetical protein